MHPISDSIYFKYKSTGLVHVCILNEQNVCTDKKPVLLNANTLTIKDIASRTVKIKLRNPSSSRNIDVTAIYHSSDVEHCRKFKFGQLYAEATLVKEACLSVIIPQGKDFELFFSRQEFGELEYTILLCERAFSMGNSPDGEIRMTVSAVAYAKECQGHASQELIIALNGKVTEKSGIDEKIKLQFLVQSTDGRVVLPDGVAYKGHAKVTDNFVQWFVYDLVSKEDTEIVLFGRGRFEFDVKIVDTALKLTEEFNNGPNEYASANSFFSSPSLKLTKAQIQDSKCGDCSLLIALYCNE